MTTIHHFIPLASDRLDLVPLQLADARFILELLNSPGWLAFIGDRKVHTVSDAEAYVHRIQALTSAWYWVAHCKVAQEPVGVVTVLQRDYLTHPDVGFAFLPQYQGKGLALDATLTVLHHVKAEGVSTIGAITLPHNTASLRLLEKTGFVKHRVFVHEAEELVELQKVL